MPTNYQHSRIAYPELPSPLTSDDLRRLFTPTSTEVDWARSLTASEHTQCGLLSLLKIFQTLGRFIAPDAIPLEVFRHIANHSDWQEDEHIEYIPRTLYRHHAHVREFLGVSEWSPNGKHLARETMERLATARVQPADLINGAIDALIRERFELPAASTLRRMAGNVQQRVHERLFDQIARRLTASERHALDALLNVPDGTQESTFARLCRSPGRATRTNLRALTKQLHWLGSFLDPSDALAGIAPAKVERWADEAHRLTAAELGAYRTRRRHALLLSLLSLARGRVLDDLVTMMIKIARQIQHQAEAALEAWLVKRRAASEQLILILRDVVDAYQRDAGPAEFHETTCGILEAFGGAGEVSALCKDRLRHRARGWRGFTRRPFRSQRAALMNLAEALPLRAMPGEGGVLKAVQMVLACRAFRDEWIQIEDFDASFLHREWRALASDPEEPGVYNRRMLEIALLFELADALKSSDICVPGSRSYGAYTDHLYPIESDPQAVAAYLAERQLPGNGQLFAAELRNWLGRHIHGLESSVMKYQTVTLDRDGMPSLPRTPASKPSESATELENAMLKRLPRRTILEALYNTDRWTGWSRRFGPPARIAPQLKNPSERYVLTSFAYGCGLGPTQASQHFTGSVSPHLLAFVNRRHIGADSLRAACNDLINCYAKFELPACWGTGNAAAADGTLFETYEDNLLAAHHVRYGRTGGIAYRHIADTYIALFSHFIPCGVHEATYILDGLLKNTSDVQPSRLHADTHGQSMVVFGLAYLLGIELMPRIRNWRKLTLYCTDIKSRPLHTAHLYGPAIDWELIAAHWEDYQRVALAIQKGQVSAAWLLTRLNSYSRRNRLYLAFRELGRVVRTVYLLRWIAEDSLRSTVTGGANKVETFHNFSSYLRFAGNGVLRTNDPLEQEKATIYNQLVANAVMLQTVADQTRILHELHEEGTPAHLDDLAFLSPYVTRKLKRFGEYPTRCKTEPLPNETQLPS